MLRRKRAEVHINQERWLVSYADFITLLFAFFVVMYSISQVNQSKYRVLSETFVEAFKAPGQLASDQTNIDLVAPVNTTLNPIQVGQPPLSTATNVIDLRSDEIGHNESAHRDEFAEISDLFAERLGDLINEQLVSVASNELWLQIELKDSILFASGSADPSLQAQAIFDEVALILQDYPNPVQVEGYTDNVPIKSALYPSNWELSTARASAIVKWLAAKGIDPTRLSAAGFGEYQPIADNATAEGRAQNRRVVLMIARKTLPRPGTPLATQRANLSTSDSASSDMNTSVSLSPALTVPESTVLKPATPRPTMQKPATADSATPDSTTPESTTPESATGSTTAAPTDLTTPSGPLAPIELEDGGLLFTSDPDLPRSNR